MSYKNTVVLVLLSLMMSGKGYAVDISDAPLETAIVQAPPIVMYVFDNSGSMDLEFMTDESQGLFEGACYLFPDAAYSPKPDHEFGTDHALCAADRRKWRSQWAGYNRLYYCPRQTYAPWPATREYAFENADLHHPLSSPILSSGINPRLAMADRFFTVRCGQESIHVTNAHYFTYHDADGNGRLDREETVYLVTWSDGDQDGYLDLAGTAVGDGRRYFRLMDDGDGLVEDDELLPVLDESEMNLIRPSDQSHDYLTDKEELQNFVNWFSYYRRRSLAAKAVTARAISNARRMYVGLYAVNPGPRVGARMVNELSSVASASEEQESAFGLMDALYACKSSGRTPLRSALDRVGRYLHPDRASDLGVSPLRLSGGQGCQRACAVVVSDGFNNGDFSGVGNMDGGQGEPYADAWSDTLADIAMAYYQTDLAPGLPDSLPVSRCDAATHQHMNVIAVPPGLGEGRNGNPGDLENAPPAACIVDDPSIEGHWPQLPVDPGVEGGSVFGEDFEPPAGLRGSAALASLRHAALNGRGWFFDADSHSDIAAALAERLAAGNESFGAADMVIEGTFLSTDTKAFLVSYRTGDWSGEVSAHSLTIGVAPDGVDLGKPLWRAAELLPGGDDGDGEGRRIVTYGGRCLNPQGIAFRYRKLSDSQLKALGPAPATGSAADQRTEELVDYIRGEPLPGCRTRQTLLGDIVHSTPVQFGRTLFVGANDGMLHAFDTDSGTERFGYVPGLIYGHLRVLAHTGYSERHRYYVDGPLHVGEVMVGEFRRKALLVGGLGKGGKGYFCLQVGYRERTQVAESISDYRWKFHVDDLGPGDTENRIAELVRWEYPRPDFPSDAMDNDGDGSVDEPDEADPNIGYSFSAAYAVNANCTESDYRPVVIFGNGYNSDSQKALLYVLDADSGAVVRIIDTGADVDNGLSTPALVDVNLDRRVDYAYAGDLNGNLWKFDLTAANPEKWGVAYGVDRNTDGVIDAADGDEPEPLFRAPGQPITGRPNVMIMHGGCKAQAPGYMVFFGTGRYLAATDRSDVSQQSLYGIWDYGDDSDDGEYLGELVDRSDGRLSSGLFLVPKRIAEESALEGTAIRRLDADELDYDTMEDGEDSDGCAVNNDTAVRQDNPKQYAGWFFDFPLPPDSAAASAERVVGDVTIRDGKVVVASYVPDNQPCGGGGDSWLYLLTACTGDSPPSSADETLASRRYSGKISGRITITKDEARPCRDLVLFRDPSGGIRSLEMSGENWGKVYWWQSR